jgi:DNA-directed RNA polymerase specialized sigma24 family protein
LTEEERQIVILRSIEGLKHREIAKLLAIPLGTALSKYHRSLSKLRTILEEEGK